MYTVSIKQAVNAASDWVKELVPSATNLRLEQVDTDETGTRWEVVVSYAERDENPFSALNPQGGRIYKSVAIDREDGQPLSYRAWGV